MASSLERTIAPGPSDASDRPGVSLTDALLLVTTVIWGVNYTVVKYGTTVLDPLAFNGARIVLATVAFGALALWRRTRRISRRDTFALLALGVLGNGIYQALFAEGVAHTRAGTAALILSASPAFIALLGRATGLERVRARNLAGIALSMAGIALVVFGGVVHETRGSSLGGDLTVLAGAGCWAVYIVLLKPYTHRVSLIDVSALTLLGGAVPLLIGSAGAIAATSWTQIAPLTWGAIAFSGLGSLVIGYLFWYRGVRLIGPTRTAIYSNVQPVIALLVAWVVLNEVPTLWQALGTGTIIAGLVLTRT